VVEKLVRNGQVGGDPGLAISGSGGQNNLLECELCERGQKGDNTLKMRQEPKGVAELALYLVRQ
jgi:hypothetical protein